MIECKNVSVGYGKENIIDSVSFKCESGKITAILGKNGCGKSTLFRAISGNQKYGGSVSVDGNSINLLSAKKRALMISLMPQILHSPKITVHELVSCGRQPYTGFSGILSETDKLEIEKAISQVNIEALSDSYLDNISGGELQKAYIAMILAQNTRNILLDEPGSHLDAQYTNNLFDILTAEKENGKTIIVILHDINRAVEIADKIAVISDKRIIFDGTPKEFCQSEIPKSIFGLSKFTCTDGSVFFR